MAEIKRHIALLCCLVWVACLPSAHAQRIEPVGQTLMSDSIVADTSLDSIIGIYRAKMSAEMNRKIGTSTEQMIASRPESSLTRLLSDILLTEAAEYARANNCPVPTVALLNVGGIRNTLSQGDITVGNIYEIAPFENKVVIEVVTADVLHDVLRRVAQVGGEAVSGIEMTIAGGRVVSAAVGGRPVGSAENYVVATIDYLSRGGDGFAAFRKRTAEFATGILLRDMIISHIEKCARNGLSIMPPDNVRIKILDDGQQ